METDFYSWINAKIDASELTKRGLAEKAGISASLVYAVTTEGRDPSTAFCVAVAPVLGVPTLELLKRAGYAVVPDKPILDELTRLTAQLSAEDRAVVLRIVKALGRS